MPNIHQYKYYLRFDDSGTWKYYYIDTNGAIQNTATKTELQFTPSGWRAKILQLIRGYEYWGVLRSFSLPLRFVKDGAKILRYLNYTYGVEAKCQLYIERFDNTIAVWDYYDYYAGDIDFSRANDTKNYFTIEITESGFLSKFKAKENTTKEIEVTNNADVIWVRMDGLDLQATANWTSLPSEEVENSLTPKIPTFVNYKYSGINLNMNYINQIISIGDYFSIMLNHSDVSQDVTLTYDFYYNIFIPGSTSSSAYFTLLYEIVRDYDHTVQSKEILYQSPTALAIGSSATYLGSDTRTITIPAKHSVVTTIRMFITSGSTSASELNPSAYDARQITSEISMTLFNKVPETYIPALRTLKVGTELITNIDSTTTFESDLLTVNEVEVLTCGDALRNLDNAVLKTSISEFYDAMNSQYGTCMQYDSSANKVNIEELSTIFITGTPIDIGEVAEMEITPFISEMFSKLKIGYPLVNTKEINGKDDPNTELEFQAPITRITKELNLVSPYHGSAIEAEIIRANLDGKTDADAESDNDVFWLKIEDTSAGTVPSGPGAGQPYYNLYRNPSLTITGVLSPTTLFNIDFSPKRRLFKYGPFIKSVFYPLSSEVIEFTTIAKSTNTGAGMVTDDAGNIITEKQSESISNLDGDVLFYPILFRIGSHNVQQFNTLQSNPYKEIQFSYKGLDYYGWLVEFGDMPTADQKQDYVLLCSPTTDLTNLIV